MTIVVTQIVVDPDDCGPYSSPLPNGMHRIVVHMTVTTSGEMATDTLPSLKVTPWDFNIVGPDGVTENQDLADGLCYDVAKQIGPDAGPGESLAGVVELQSKYPAGILLYRPTAIKPSGWEWTF